MAIYTRDAWHGGFYELAMELGPRSDQRLRAALSAVWEQPDLDGCYLRPDVEPGRQPRIHPDAAELAGPHLRGLATLPDGKAVACGTCIVREEDGPDWLYFYVPMGTLTAAYPGVGGFPFSDEPSRFWREPLESWLALVGERAYRRAPFRLGLIGFEVSAFVSSDEVSADGVPDERHNGYLRPADGGVRYDPTNLW